MTKTIKEKIQNVMVELIADSFIICMGLVIGYYIKFYVMGF